MDVRQRPPWARGLTGTPGDTLLFELGMVYWTLKTASERCIGITRARLRLLGILARSGEVSQAELQRVLDVDGAAVTRQVKQLEGEGLVTRRPAPRDNRLTLVSLTPAGKEQLMAAAQKGRAFAKQAVAGIDADEIENVRRVLEHLRANLTQLSEGEMACEDESQRP